jgi:hypothetical protein
MCRMLHNKFPLKNVAAYYTSEAAVLLGAVSKAAILRSNMSLFSLSTRSHRARIDSSSCFKLSICSCKADNMYSMFYTDKSTQKKFYQRVDIL